MKANLCYFNINIAYFRREDVSKRFENLNAKILIQTLVCDVQLQL